MMNTGDTDPTFIETNIPWVMRVIGDDRQQAYLLIDYLYRKTGPQAGRRSSAPATATAGSACGRSATAPAGWNGPCRSRWPTRSGRRTSACSSSALKNANPDAVVHWGNAVEGALILNQMRAMGMTQPFFACDRTRQRRVRARSPATNAEGVVARVPVEPGAQGPEAGARSATAFRERFGTEPGDLRRARLRRHEHADLGHPDVAGLNRAKIRDVLAYLPHAVAGRHRATSSSRPALDDVGDIYLAKYENGGWKYYSRAELGIPKGYIPPRDRLNRDGQQASRDRPAARRREGMTCSRRGLRRLVLVALALGAAGAAARRWLPQPPRAASCREPQPSEAGQAPLEFPGSGREDPEPDVSEVVLGWFGPGDADHREFGSLWRGALLALDEENAAGGYRPARVTAGAFAGQAVSTRARVVGEPVAGGHRGPAEIVYAQQAWAVIGGVDGTTTHLAVQTALKSRFLLFSPGSTDISQITRTCRGCFRCRRQTRRSLRSWSAHWPARRRVARARS